MSAYPNLVWAPFLADHLLKSLGVFEVRPLLLYPGLSCHSKPGMDKLGWHPAWGGVLCPRGGGLPYQLPKERARKGAEATCGDQRIIREKRAQANLSPRSQGRSWGLSQQLWVQRDTCLCLLLPTPGPKDSQRT